MVAAEVKEVRSADILFLVSACEKDLRQGKSVGGVVAGSRCFTLKISGETVFAWAARRIGNELWIDAAAGKAGGIDLTKCGLSIVEAQAAGLETVAFQTTRKGLVKKAKKLGYEIDAYVMRKKL